MRKCLLAVVLLLLTAASAWAEPAVVRKGLEVGQGAVYYPQVEGMDDPALQDAVNAQLLHFTGAEELLTRLALTMHSPVPLTADFTHTVSGDVLSVALCATGPVVNDRATQVWYAANVDLTTGEPIAFDDLFTDPAAARAALEEYLEWELAPSLSAHLRSAQLTPLPETFSLSASGVTLHYPMEQLSTLSDRAGTVSLMWYELGEHLRLEAGSVPARMGAAAMLTLGEDSAQAIREAAESGALPGIPVQLGGSVQEAVDTHRLLIDPDLYEHGRLIQLEGGAFRGVYLLTDSLTDSWAHSVIQGVRADRINLYGLCTGRTAREDWRACLGEPDFTVTLDGDQAWANRLVPGVSDYYHFDGVSLRLHANEDGVLTTLILNQN